MSKNTRSSRFSYVLGLIILTAISGLAWTSVYIDSIRIGFRQKTYAMPMAALALNFAWESTYAVQSLTTAVSLQGLVNLVWALADLVIVVDWTEP